MITISHVHFIHKLITTISHVHLTHKLVLTISHVQFIHTLMLNTNHVYIIGIHADINYQPCAQFLPYKLCMLMLIMQNPVSTALTFTICI